MARERFSRDAKLGKNFYVRQDGTRSYFFSADETKALMESAGLRQEQCVYKMPEVVNRKRELTMQRIFLQGKFVKV